MELSEFKNSDLAKLLIREIHDLPVERIRLMEVCGTHTFQIAKLGLHHALEGKVEFLSGPGCPVCVTSMHDIDRIVQLAKIDNAIIATFGDMIKVTGSISSLGQQRAEGAEVRVLYSALDSLDLAKNNTKKQVILIGIGFETTTPLIASTIIRGAQIGLENFSVFSINKNMPHMLRMLLQDGEFGIDGLLLPGHISTIIGFKEYDFIANDFHIPGVVAGFELVDILQAVLALGKQVSVGKAKIENAYSRVVKKEGNIKAKSRIEQVFDTCSARWRGFGVIENSGYKIKSKFVDFDASVKFSELIALADKIVIPFKYKSCSCNKVLRGSITPDKCSMFKVACRPEKPLGPCMVSSEGSCAAYYKYLK
ncbi:MAG: hydrogenase formation protein HypD [Eggerthellaceae bacterium]|nr:hydrogenase formation protein HypD [Eggerthellaceae bacterium]